MTTWTCRTCGPIPHEEIYLLTWDSPHGEEAHTVCGGGDLDLIDTEPEEQQ